MLIDKDKLYIKNYKIYRADADIRRRGVLILVSNQIKAQTYRTYKDNDGRYIQIKIKENEDTYIDIATGYLEPTKENNLELLLEALENINFFAGDLNKAQTGMEIKANVYHIKGIKIKEIIKQKNIISDHPIMIGEIISNLEIKNKYESIKKLDRDIIKRNMDNFKENIMKDQLGEFSFEDPLKNKIINKNNFFDDLDYQEEYESIKNNNRKIFVEKRKQREKDIAYLLSYDNLGKKSLSDLTNLIQIKNKNEYWKLENEAEKDMVLQGFKNLYLDKGEKNITKEYLCNIIKNTLQLIKNIPDIENIQIKINEPKSNAKDFYGFNQSEIFNILKSENYIEIINKILWIINTSEKSESSKYLIHNKSKIFLKKRKIM